MLARCPQRKRLKRSLCAGISLASLKSTRDCSHDFGELDREADQDNLVFVIPTEWVGTRSFLSTELEELKG